MPSVCVSKPGRLIIRLSRVVSDKMRKWLGEPQFMYCVPET